MERDLDTTDSMVAASVAVYMYAVGLGALLLGPTADRFGRRVTLSGATLLFVALSLVCVFAPNINGGQRCACWLAVPCCLVWEARLSSACPFPHAQPTNRPPPTPHAVLLAFRALQGFVVSGCSTTSNAILADVYAPEERGRAMGLAAIPFLVGGGWVLV